MRKKELISKIVNTLHENNARKKTPLQKSVLHVSDDYGNTSDFIIRKNGSSLLYTVADVTAIIEAFVAIVTDSIRRGEEVNIHGFGTFGINYRAPREAVHPATGERIAISETCVPKFTFGQTLRMAARVFAMESKENEEKVVPVEGNRLNDSLEEDD